MKAIATRIVVSILPVLSLLLCAPDLYGQGDSIRIEGRIMDSDGNPIAGASVRVVNDDGAVLSNEDGLTDEAGIYRFFALDRPTQRSHCIATHPDYSFGAKVIGLNFDEDPSEEWFVDDIVLFDRSPFQITVVDDDQVAVEISNAQISTVSYARNFLDVAEETIPNEWQFGPFINGSNIELPTLPINFRVSIHVTVPGQGTQNVYVERTADECLVRLLPVGSLTGNVTAGESEIPSDLALTISTRHRTNPGQRNSANFIRPSGGRATVNVRDDGTFEVTEIATGSVRFQADLDLDQPLRLDRRTPGTIRAGVESNFDVHLLEATLVRGTITDDGGVGIADVWLSLPGGEIVFTNELGMYSVYVLPGSSPVSISPPKPYLAPPLRAIYLNIPSEGNTFDVPPVRLDTGRKITGIVVDEHGDPIAGADVLAGWYDTDGTTGSSTGHSTRTDEEGRYELELIRPGVVLSLRASTSDRATIEPRVIGPDDTDAQTLTVSPEGVVQLETRIVDPSGKPIVGAQAIVWMHHVDPTHQAGSRSRLQFDGAEFLISDDDGMISFPRALNRYARYHLQVSANGHRNRDTDPFDTIAFSGLHQLPDVVLSPLRRISGSVVTAEGDPLPNVDVWTHGSSPTVRPETTTDQNGVFLLDDVPSDALFVFAGLEGYRQGGALIEFDSEPIQVTLSPFGSSLASDSTVSEVLTATERHALAKELLVAMCDRAKRDADTGFFRRMVHQLAKIDPEAALTLLEDIDDPDARVDVLSFIGSPDEVLAEARLIEDPYAQVSNLRRAVDNFDDPDSRLYILEEAAILCRQISTPSRRVVMTAYVAEALIDCEQLELASTLLESIRTTSLDLTLVDFDGYARGLAAESFAIFDPDLAWELVEPLSDISAKTRHLGNIAHELGEHSPESAERFLSYLPLDMRHLLYERTISRMGRSDRARAVRMIESIQGRSGSITRARCYGALAMAIASDDPVASRNFLREAFDSFSFQSQPNVEFQAALALLDYVGNIDPDSFEEYAWRTLALHSGPHGPSYPETEIELASQRLFCDQLYVLGLMGQSHRFREEGTKRIAANWINQETLLTRRARRNEIVLCTILLNDPQATIQWLTDVAAADQPLERNYQELAVLYADLLTSPEGKLHESVMRFVFHSWVIGKEDYEHQMSD